MIYLNQENWDHVGTIQDIAFKDSDGGKKKIGQYHICWELSDKSQ